MVLVLHILVASEYSNIKRDIGTGIALETNVNIFEVVACNDKSVI